MPAQSISDRLRDAVRATGKSQNDIARQLNVTATTLSRWLRGENEPPLEQLARILALAKVSANELLGLPEPKPEKGTIDKDGEHFDTLSSAAGRVGAGPAILDPQEGRRYAFHLDWLRKQPAKGKHLRMVWVDKKFGDSMIPTIHPGSMLAVDLGPGGRGYSELGPHDGKVFLVRPEPEALGPERRRNYLKVRIVLGWVGIRDRQSRLAPVCEHKGGQCPAVIGAIQGVRPAAPADE